MRASSRRKGGIAPKKVGNLWTRPSRARVNPRPAGGETAHPRPFPSISSKTEKNRATKFSEPLPTSILHMLTK